MWGVTVCSGSGSTSSSKTLRRHMSSDSVISAVSTTSQQSLMSTADVDGKKKKNKNWVENYISQYRGRRKSDASLFACVLKKVPLHLRPSLHYHNCEHDILKLNESILMQIGASGPRGVKRPTWEVRGSKIKVTAGRFVGLGRHLSRPLRLSEFSSWK